MRDIHILGLLDRATSTTAHDTHPLYYLRQSLDTQWSTSQAAQRSSKRASQDGGGGGGGSSDSTVASAIRTSITGAAGAADSPQATTKAMNNYMGIGIDAKVCLAKGLLQSLEAILRLSAVLHPGQLNVPTLFWSQVALEFHQMRDQVKHRRFPCTPPAVCTVSF